MDHASVPLVQSFSITAALVDAMLPTKLSTSTSPLLTQESATSTAVSLTASTAITPLVSAISAKEVSLFSTILAMSSAISDSVLLASLTTTAVLAIIACLWLLMEVLAYPATSPTLPTAFPALKTTSVACANLDISLNLQELVSNATSPTASSADHPTTAAPV